MVCASKGKEEKPSLEELRGIKEKTHQGEKKLSLDKPSSSKISLNSKENIPKELTRVTRTQVHGERQ